MILLYDWSIFPTGSIRLEIIICKPVPYIDACIEGYVVNGFWCELQHISLITLGVVVAFTSIDVSECFSQVLRYRMVLNWCSVYRRWFYDLHFGIPLVRLTNIIIPKSLITVSCWVNPFWRQPWLSKHQEMAEEIMTVNQKMHRERMTG